MNRVVGIILLLGAVVLVMGVSASGPSPATPAFPAGPSSGEQSLAIIVNQGNPVENFSLDELRKIFLGERSHWPNGRRITLVMLDPNQPERKVVLREIYGMSEKDFNTHFMQGVFTGAVTISPKTFTNSSEVRRFVFNVPGAIGYVRASDVDASVKVLRIDGRLPDDKDYRLRLQAH
jgi:ABC-type phosphate transport system substrate-binding protein